MSARTYWVGLPVGITVHDDGTVEYEIDTSEAGSSIAEDFSQNDGIDWDEDRMLLDMAIADGKRADHANSPGGTVFALHLREMRCPVRYACGFETQDVRAMEDHIAWHRSTNEA